MADETEERLRGEIMALEWRLKDARAFARRVAGIVTTMTREGRYELTDEERAICQRARTF